MPLIACNCPNCGGKLDFDDSRDFLFCQFCGTKVLREQVTNVTNNITIADGYQIHDADWYYDTIRALYLKFDETYDRRARALLKDFEMAYPLDDRIEKLTNFHIYNPDPNKFSIINDYEDYYKGERFYSTVLQRKNPTQQYHTYIEDDVLRCQQILKDCLEENRYLYNDTIQAFLEICEKGEEKEKYEQMKQTVDKKVQKEEKNNTITLVFVILATIAFFIFIALINL